MKNAYSQIKKHFLDPKNPSSIVEFLATVKLICSSNKIHEGAARCVLPHYVQDIFANALNSRMFAKNRLAALAASVQSELHQSYKLQCLYP